MDTIGLNSDNLDLLKRVLDLTSKRQQLLAGNIANVNTPGFRTKDVDFAEHLKAATAQRGSLPVAQSHHNHLATGGPAGLDREPEVIEVEGLAERNDNNNVSSDREMANMAENSLQYMLAVQLVTREFNLIRTAIKEGRI